MTSRGAQTRKNLALSMGVSCLSDRGSHTKNRVFFS
jgi:hypothetical protein